MRDDGHCPQIFVGYDGHVFLAKEGQISYFIALGTTTVGALPAAGAGNVGQIIKVSDSTAVATEGQTCVGSSTNTALAFSTGTVWKCF